MECFLGKAKKGNSLEEVKQKIDRWTPENYPNKICKTDVYQIVYFHHD